MEKSDRKSDPKVLLIAQELELIRMLSGNDQKTRNKALKNLGKWLQNRAEKMPITEEVFQRMWKGLYYCMWMCDKPLVQEECADKISKLVHSLDVNNGLLFFKAGFFILCNEWSGIQQLRLDKFLMLVRRLLREVLFLLKNNKYNKTNIEAFSEVLSETVLNKNKNTPVGLFMHFVEIFLEELAKVSEGKLQPHMVLEFIKPFIKCLATLTDGRQIGHLRKFIFTYLIRQSKLGLDYQTKYEAWKQQGFPGSIDSMQKIKINKEDISSDEEQEERVESHEKPLDPRAGRVDVEIPPLHFKAADVAKTLLEYKFDKESSSQSRAMIKTLANQFTSLSKGIYPLGVKKVQTVDENDNINIRKAATRLIKFDQKIMGKKNKKRKHDKENNEDVIENKRIKVNNETNQSRKKKNKKDDNNPQSTKEKKLNDITKKNKDNKITSNINKPKDKSQNDVKKKKTNKKLKSKRKILDENVECIFKRNSGTWIVYEVNKKEQPEAVISDSSKKVKSDFEESKETGLNLSLASDNANKFTESPLNSSKLGISPIKLFESPPREKEIFSKSEWDDPLQEGEYEICIPSKKHVKKLKKQAQNHNKTVHELINSTLQKIKGKSRLSLDSKLVNDPFSRPNSAKKVKINTKLNRSQEVHEHYISVKSSPGIPFDASKKPTKPLLKPTAVSTPINPFYKKQLKF